MNVMWRYLWDRINEATVIIPFDVDRAVETYENIKRAGIKVQRQFVS
jgi:hypothetical protein